MRLAMIIGLTLTALAACNTVEGAGKDISASGAAIEDAAKQASE